MVRKVVNPLTGRKIQVGGGTYNNLYKKGYLNKRSSRKVIRNKPMRGGGNGVKDITETIPENMESLLDTQVFLWFTDDGAGLYGSDAFGKIVSRDVKGDRDDSPIAWVDANNELSIDYKAGVPYTDKFYIPTEESEKYIKDKEDQIHKGLSQLFKLYKSKGLDSLETTDEGGFTVWKPENMTLFHFANWDKFSKYLIN